MSLLAGVDFNVFPDWADWQWKHCKGLESFIRDRLMYKVARPVICNEVVITQYHQLRINEATCRTSLAIVVKILAVLYRIGMTATESL